MNLKYSNIDPTNSSVEEIQNEINRLNLLMNLKKNEEQAIKIFINSVYGATASIFFVGYNVKVAEAITLQGQEIRAYAAKIFNRYFLEFWHRDYELHKKLGISNVQKISNEVSIYGDTDSCYITFEEVVKSCDWKGDYREFILKIYENRLYEYIKKSYEKYASDTGTENIQDLEMETISYSVFLLKKKKYCLDLAWKAGPGGGIYYEPQKKIKAIGVEIIQSSTPLFARDKLKSLLIILFKEKKQLNMRNFTDLLRKEKKEFILDNVENISMSSKVGEYEKGISDDRKKFIINDNCPIHVRAAGFHNFLVNNSKWKNKYQLIKSDDKVKYYYAKNDEGGENVFGYLPGNFPVEIAPPVNYDLQFEKCIIDPINRFIVAMNLPAILPELVVRTQLF